MGVRGPCGAVQPLPVRNRRSLDTPPAAVAYAEGEDTHVTLPLLPLALPQLLQMGAPRQLRPRAAPLDFFPGRGDASRRRAEGGTCTAAPAGDLRLSLPRNRI